jgi:hypothetical protein
LFATYMTARPIRPRSALGTMSAFLEASAAGLEEEEEAGCVAPPSLMLAMRALPQDHEQGAEKWEKKWDNVEARERRGEGRR